MAIVTRTFSTTADSSLFAQLDAAMAYTFNVSPVDGTPAVAGQDHTTDCLHQWALGIVTNFITMNAAHAMNATVAAAVAAASHQLAITVTTG